MINWSGELACKKGAIVGNAFSYADCSRMISVDVGGARKNYLVDDITGWPLKENGDWAIFNVSREYPLVLAINKAKEDGCAWACERDMNFLYINALTKLGWTPPKED